MSDPITIKPRQPTKTDLEGQEKPLDREEKLEAGLEESMDASDPPATTAPGDHGDPVPSSGFTEGKDEKGQK
ncbi:MAG TPA: hypothetical protein VF503_22865 [Sphingobium sp.]|uniref:hypothetical protein n=1 Tax=Sphingobium sp. TaxID=1912891 RepID=UPI002ED61716